VREREREERERERERERIYVQGNERKQAIEKASHFSLNKNRAKKNT